MMYLTMTIWDCMSSIRREESRNNFIAFFNSRMDGLMLNPHCCHPRLAGREQGMLGVLLCCMISIFRKVAWQPRGLAGSWVGVAFDGSFLDVFLGMNGSLRGWIDCVCVDLGPLN